MYAPYRDVAWGYKEDKEPMVTLTVKDCLDKSKTLILFINGVNVRYRYGGYKSLHHIQRISLMHVSMFESNDGIPSETIDLNGGWIVASVDQNEATKEKIKKYLVYMGSSVSPYPNVGSTVVSSTGIEFISNDMYLQQHYWCNYCRSENQMLANLIKQLDECEGVIGKRNKHV